MAFVCPVCSAPQADGEHLATHLAFSALLHGDDHEAWLETNVPDWSERDPASLASAVTPLAEETDHEVSTGGPAAGDRGRSDRGDAATPPVDPETRRIVEEARELTRRMRARRTDEE